MIDDEIRQKLQNIISGTLLEEQEDHCTAIRNLLCQGFGSNPTVKREFESRSIVKEEQARFLKIHAETNKSVQGVFFIKLANRNPYRLLCYLSE
ncbi:hypothetical protein A4H97_29450 [Niastella yeongjuensis]|uniref:Uncharacterized protein n=1 Tax=Niastella yeongjuensis TaxID=354355 RepID=A0A1V9ESF3_9BACT|nr:hypothetical protein [Niastella yeongjuensis]OQP49011.1 hypothetical protein A4H97_29450 [Niastella yeongjuensis]